VADRAFVELWTSDLLEIAPDGPTASQRIARDLALLVNGEKVLVYSTSSSGGARQFRKSLRNAIASIQPRSRGRRPMFRPRDRWADTLSGVGFYSALVMVACVYLLFAFIVAFAGARTGNPIAFLPLIVAAAGGFGFGRAFS
jgi:hypothetical protein